MKRITFALCKIARFRREYCKLLSISNIWLHAQNSRISSQRFCCAFNSQFWAVGNANIVTGAVAISLFFIPFEEFLHSFFYFHFVGPSERMQLAYTNWRICWQRYDFFTVFVALLHRQLLISKKKLPTYFESKNPKTLRFPVEIYQKSIDIHDLSICFSIFA